MRWSSLLAAAALAVAVEPGAAAAQLTLERVAAGPAFSGGAFVDPGFQHAFSFRAGGFAPGSGGADAILGGVGACHAGEPCSSSAARDWAPGESQYFVGIQFGGQLVGPPHLYVNDVTGNADGEALELDGWDPNAPLNAFYVVLTPPVGGTMALANGTFFGFPPTDAPGFTTNGAGSWYALYRYDDLHDGLAIFDLAIAGNVAGAGAPTIEVYVGSLPTTAAPEPATVALVTSGLLAIVVIVRRRTRRTLATIRTAPSPRR